jgi:hypothetical protein
MDVFLDRRLPDYFREHAWQHVRAEGGGAAFADFLGERLGVVHGYDLGGLDRAFLAGLDFPQTWDFKKLQVASILRGGAQAADMVLRDGFRGDRGAFQHFVEQIRQLERIGNELLAAIVPGRPDVVNLVTRFSETRMENLHYDLDTGADDHEAFRVYVNLDAAPRVWATSYQMTDLVRRGGQRLVQGLDATQPGETILKRIVSRAYGGWNQRATERMSPRHLVYVDPGDVFFVDGRCVSHQVMTGHRVFTIYAKIPHGAREVQPTFAAKLRGALADAQRVPVGQETALVNYFEPAQVTAAPQVKEQWQSVFGDTRTGRIRRFDDNGLVAGG